jgi:hypothetical protein
MERTGVTPVERPTEWTMAVVMLITAFFAWRTDHDTGALIAVAAAALPVIVTAITAWYDRRQAQQVPAPVPTTGTGENPVLHAPEGGE